MSFVNLTLKRKLKAQLKIKNKIENVLTNLYNKGISKYQQYLKLLIPKKELYQLVKQEFIKEYEIIPIDKKHRKRPVTGNYIYNLYIASIIYIYLVLYIYIV